MTMRLAGGTALVTGGASGIGLALARAFLAAGLEVAICGRDAAKLERARAQHEKLWVYRCDVADAGAVDALLGQLVEDGLNANILVNNAATHTPLDFRHGAEAVDAIGREIAVNLVAPMVLTAKLLPSLLVRPEAAIVNIGSGLALVPKRTAPMYCASKAGLHAFSIALRGQLECTTVHVLEVLPGQVETEMARGRGPSRKLSADALAAQVLDALTKGRSELLPGPMGRLALLARIAPGLAAARVRAMTEPQPKTIP